MKSALIIVILFLITSQSYSQQYGRLESEYKLSVPDDQKDEVWTFLQERFLNSGSELSNRSISATRSSEKFIDQYFDSKDQILSKNKSGLRLRKRYVKDTLIKELIQLKLPQDSLGLTRTEIKFELDNKRSAKDLWDRHPFMKYIRKSDLEKLNFHLSHLFLKVDQLAPALKLVQKRDRIYIADSISAIATVTLDKVNNINFPFQGFVELEIELNEIRYTDAESEERAEMDMIREELKTIIVSEFNDLKVDQTPKYNKMGSLIQESILGKLYKNIMWIIFGVIILIAAYLKFTE